MRTLESKVTHEVVGVTVGQRTYKGEHQTAILFDDNSIEWYGDFKFDALYKVV